jgi:uncharacterized protein YacL
VLNRIIKASFAAVGAVTGFTVAGIFFNYQEFLVFKDLRILIFIAASAIGTVIFYSTGNQIIIWTTTVLNNLEGYLQKMTLYEIMMSVIGLIAGLIVANLVTIPINKIYFIGVPIAITLNILFGGLGIYIANHKRNENVIDFLRGKGRLNRQSESLSLKLMDTSAIIDGRVVDICRTGFIEGELVIPTFVLDELRQIADSPDVLKRNRGRRGLEILNILQNELQFPVRIESTESIEGQKVDFELLKLAKKLNAQIITVDYNLSKVACLQGIAVLNMNDLSNAVKPIALPGEEMVVQVIKDGRENGQGVGYLEDGTMIVVDGGKKHIGESISVMVTSVLQTDAGRMVFAKPKYLIERVI